MAVLKFDRKKLKENFDHLQVMLDSAQISWAVVTKILCGNKALLSEVLALQPDQICDSRVKNLKAIKQLNPQIETIYIKPPPKRSIASIVKYADISFNTQLETIKLLSDEAIKQNKNHKILIMIELGDLREGVLGEQLSSFYEQVFDLQGVQVIGLGANLNCLNGVMPSQDKLIQLALYKNLLEARFGRKLPVVSGGSTVTLPLIEQHQLPAEINHFRIGEALYFGINLFTGKLFPGMHGDVFQLHCEIIELTEKSFAPVGELAANPSGDQVKIVQGDYKKMGHRCIIDVGLLDLNPKFMKPDDPDIKVLGASSDMIVLELTQGPKDYKVGSYISFTIDYMGVLGLMNSKYIDKEVI